MRLFWPASLPLRMRVVLDAEDPEAHAAAINFTRSWPFPAISYEERFSAQMRGKERQQLSMLWADKHTGSKYVGFLDTDTIYVTTVTQQSMFVDDKPVVFGAVGKPVNTWWNTVPASTMHVLGLPETMKCMSYFPVIIAADHLRQLRSHVENMHNRPFNDVIGDVDSSHWCHFSIICTYIWHYHRQEYSFFVQEIVSGVNETVTGQDPDFQSILKSTGDVKARTTNHFRWVFESKTARHRANSTLLAALLRRGFCYATDFTNRMYCHTTGHESQYPKDIYRFEQTFLPAGEQEKYEEYLAHRLHAHFSGHNPNSYVKAIDEIELYKADIDSHIADLDPRYWVIK